MTRLALVTMPKPIFSASTSWTLSKVARSHKCLLRDSLGYVVSPMTMVVLIDLTRCTYTTLGVIFQISELLPPLIVCHMEQIVCNPIIFRLKRLFF